MHRGAHGELLCGPRSLRSAEMRVRSDGHAVGGVVGDRDYPGGRVFCADVADDPLRDAIGGAPMVAPGRLARRRALCVSGAPEQPATLIPTAAPRAVAAMLTLSRQPLRGALFIRPPFS